MSDSRLRTFCARSLSLANLDGALSDRWCALAALLSCIPVIFLPSPPNPAHAPVDDKPDKGEEAEGNEDEGKKAPSHVMPMLWMTVWIYGMNEVCAENVFGAWISSYAELTGLATKDVAPLYQTVYYVLFTVSRFAGAPISHYCESHVIIAMFLPVAVLGIIGIMVAQAAQLSWLAWLSVGACTIPS